MTWTGSSLTARNLGRFTGMTTPGLYTYGFQVGWVHKHPYSSSLEVTQISLLYLCSMMRQKWEEMCPHSWPPPRPSPLVYLDCQWLTWFWVECGFPVVPCDQEGSSNLKLWRCHQGPTKAHKGMLYHRLIVEGMCKAVSTTPAGVSPGSGLWDFPRRWWHKQLSLNFL